MPVTSRDFVWFHIRLQLALILLLFVILQNLFFS